LTGRILLIGILLGGNKKDGDEDQRRLITDWE
jgi:hypothetical protein